MTTVPSRKTLEEAIEYICGLPGMPEMPVIWVNRYTYGPLRSGRIPTGQQGLFASVTQVQDGFLIEAVRVKLLDDEKGWTDANIRVDTYRQAKPFTSISELFYWLTGFDKLGNKTDVHDIVTEGMNTSQFQKICETLDCPIWPDA